MSVVRLNDVHSQLNPCLVQHLAKPESPDEAAHLISTWPGRVSVSGRRHSMGGRPYAVGTLCLDTVKLAQIVNFDSVIGTVTVEAGASWEQLIRFLHNEQTGISGTWGIRQKQTGADELTLGGAATDQQLRTCYPEFDAWLKEKQDRDPEKKFWSDWFAAVARQS